jgi:hypothetical protein
MNTEPLKKICKYFDSNSLKIFNRADLDIIMHDNENLFGKFPSLNRFISFVIQNTKMEQVRLEIFPRSIIKFTWGKIELLEFLLSLKPLSYFSHESALFYNNMIAEEPETIYLNFEQPDKEYGDSELLQENIDRVFQSKPRITKSITQYSRKKICMINGKYTNKLNVIRNVYKKIPIEYTDIERTLIDIVVRPQYSGGTKTISQVYKNAAGKFSIKKLITTIKKLGHKYPYHQVIGFYMEKSGKYKKKDLSMIKKLVLNYDFYVEYGHKKNKLSYNENWRIFYPKYLEK